MLKELTDTWALNPFIFTQPIGKIRLYFGEKIALYFAWLEFYTKMLVIPACAGLAIYILDIINIAGARYQKIIFAALIVVWSTLFTEFWKRKSSLYSLTWGVSNSDINALPRTQFIGVKRLNPVDNSPQIWDTSPAMARRRRLISYIVVFLMVLIVIIALGGLFILKHLSLKIEDKSTQMYATYGVSILNAVQIAVLNTIYRMVATWLNIWENHRTDIQYENSLITKVFLFQFCNSFASFIYIAFIKHHFGDRCVDDNCLGELRSQLAILFIIRIVVGNITELLIPFAAYKYRLYSENSNSSKEGLDKKSNFSEAELQSMLNPYVSASWVYRY